MKKLRIVVWNCNKALHKKTEALLSLCPDIAIVPECAEPEIVLNQAPNFTFKDADWIGLNKTKGLGVFTFGEYTLRRDESYDPDYELFLPLHVQGIHSFSLLAVWAFNHRATGRLKGSRTATVQTLEHYAEFVRGGKTVVAGDFNNSIWQTLGKKSTFSETVAALNACGVESAYHSKQQHDFGKEPEYTHFGLRNGQWREYHIDYCFVPKQWSNNIESASIGEQSEWKHLSDHAPLVVEITFDAHAATRTFVSAVPTGAS